MKLSEAIYLCIKNAIYYDDNSFTYDSFIKGKFDGDPDYAQNINNVFSPFNQAIAELSDLERIPYIVEQVSAKDYSFSLLNLEKKVKEVVAVGYFYDGRLVAVPWRKVGNLIVLPRIQSGDIYIEYKEQIPYFGMGENIYSYTYEVDATTGEEVFTSEEDIEMSDYNIDDHMCLKIIEYVKGALTEPVSPELANMHTTRAIQYFADINPVQSEIRQDRVEQVHKVW